MAETDRGPFRLEVDRWDLEESDAAPESGPAKRRKLSLSLKPKDSGSTERFVFLDNAKVEALYVPKNTEKALNGLYLRFVRGVTSAMSISGKNLTSKYRRIYWHLLIKSFFVNGLVCSSRKLGKRTAQNTLLRLSIYFTVFVSCVNIFYKFCSLVA